MRVLKFDEEIDLPEDHPDRLEYCISPYAVRRLRQPFRTRLSDFDGMTDADILREPNVNMRVLREIRRAQASASRSITYMPTSLAETPTQSNSLR